MGRPQGTMLIEPLEEIDMDHLSDLYYVASMASEGGSPFCDLAGQRGLEKRLTVTGISEARGALKAFATLGLQEHALVPRTEADKTVFDLYFPKSK